MPEQDIKLTPRWEWRTFADSLAWLERKIGPLDIGEPRHSEETYLLNSSTPHSAKIRSAVLEIKRLKQVDPSGLELWYPAFKGAFPLTSSILREAFVALGLHPPIFSLISYPIDLFLSEVIARDAAFCPVQVSKVRRQFVFGGCGAEFVRITAGGVELESFCIEDEALERVLSALRELGLDSHANVNLPNGLRWALSMFR